MKRYVGIFITAVVVLGAATFAMFTPQIVSASSAALSILPKKNYTIEPGKSVKDTLVIRNLDAAEDLELQLRVVDFTYTDDGGTPKLMLAEDAPQTTWSLKPFLTVPKTVTIPPKSSKTLDMSVAIPANQGAGSFYSAIVYSSGASEGGNVGLSASGVTLVFASVPGKVDENLKLEKFGAYKPPEGDNEGQYTFITGDEPKVMAYTLKNEGNVTEAPVGSITLRDLFGRETVINDVNPNSSLALIGQTRTYTACIKLQTEKVEFDGGQSESKECASPSLWPGYYSASLNLFYGQNGNRTQEITGGGWFWYLPLWFVVTMLILLLVVAYFVRQLVMKVRHMMYGETQTKKKSRRRR